MEISNYPSLYQINTRVRHWRFLSQVDQAVGIDSWPDSEWQGIAKQGFDWVWLLDIWQIGKAGGSISRSHEAWQEGFRANLVDLSESDICGSCFAVVRYQTTEELGGDEALAHVHKQLNQCRLRLMLDFVPNHTALDHPWVQKHPEFYIQGSTQDIDREPQNYIALETNQGRRVFTYGRDPYFNGWPDVLQLDYSQSALQAAMIDELLAIAPRWRAQRYGDADFTGSLRENLGGGER